MSYVYLYTDQTGVQYPEERMRGIAHEMYCKECTAKGRPYGAERATIYNATVITHPITGDKALQIDAGLSLQYVPSIFEPRLVSYETMEAEGWFEYIEM